MRPSEFKKNVKVSLLFSASHWEKKLRLQVLIKNGMNNSTKLYVDISGLGNRKQSQTLTSVSTFDKNAIHLYRCQIDDCFSFLYLQVLQTLHKINPKVHFSKM